MNKIIRRAITGLTVAAGATALFAPLTSLAVLQRQGPVDPANGFPAWYQDRNGIALELCTINSTDEIVNGLLINSGQCAIGNLPVPNGLQTGPEVFPNNFVVEHFYTLASGALTTMGIARPGDPITAGTGRIVINMGLEASFSTAVPTAGAQVTFSRWRVQHFNLPCTGNYTYYTPTNTPQTYPGVAGGRVFQTFDVGLTNPADVMTGHTGPFLLASDVAGGAPKAPFIGPDNKKYLFDMDAGVTRITGSTIPNGLATNPRATDAIRAMPYTNFVAVEGPGVESGVCANTELLMADDSFSMFGRFFEGAIASRNSVDRATYRVADTNNDGVPDSFQIGTWTTATQEAGGAVPQMSTRLWYTDPNNPASSSAELAMTGVAAASGPTPPAGILPTSSYRFFEGNTSPTQVNGTVTQPGPIYTNDQVRLLTDVTPTSQDVALVDEVRVTQAIWNAAAKTLTVAAESGAYLQAVTPTGGTAANSICSIPCLQLDTYGLPLTTAAPASAAIDFKMKTTTTAKSAAASIVIPNVQTPPAFIRVTSSSGGAAVQAVKLASTAAAPAFAFNNDAITLPSGTPANIDVLANDIGVNAVPNLLICTAATAGTCAVPVPATACVTGTASPQCTSIGGRISLVGNRVQYVPPVNRTGVTDTFWYQAATVVGPTSLARAQVSVSLVTVTGAPDARDDINLSSAVNRPITIDVLANDFAPAGVNVGTLAITQQPCNLTTRTCSPGTANFTTTAGKLVFTPPSAGSWNLAYTFTDNTGTVADQGLVAVNVQNAETFTIIQFTGLGVPVYSTTAKTIKANGFLSTGTGKAVQMWLPPAGVANGCTAPGTGTLLGSVTTGGLGAWTITSSVVATKPATVYFYAPEFGGCSSQTVR